MSRSALSKAKSRLSPRTPVEEVLELASYRIRRSRMGLEPRYSEAYLQKLERGVREIRLAVGGDDV